LSACSTHGATDYRDASAAAPRRPDTLYLCTGYWAVVCACTCTRRAPRASCTEGARGFRDGAPRVHAGCRRPSLLSKTNGLKKISITFFLCLCRPWGGSGVVPARFLSGSLLARAFRIQLTGKLPRSAGRLGELERPIVLVRRSAVPLGPLLINELARPDQYSVSEPKPALCLTPQRTAG
jgi:hypothetical protein